MTPRPCTFAGCDATFHQEQVTLPSQGVPGITGWQFPPDSPDDAEVGVHDHRALWHTMTTGGLYGSDVQAESAAAAEQAAVRLGYTVLDVMDDNVIIAD